MFRVALEGDGNSGKVKATLPPRWLLDRPLLRFLVCYCFCLKWSALGIAVTDYKKYIYIKNTISLWDASALHLLELARLSSGCRETLPVCSVKGLLLVTLYSDNDMFSLCSSVFSLNSFILSLPQIPLSSLYIVSRRKTYPVHFSLELVIGQTVCSN